MTTKRTKTSEKKLIFILLVCFLALYWGCNSNNFSTSNTPSSKSIIEIRVTADDESWNCIIKGNRPLTFSAINQIAPIGILLYFPDTTLNIPETDFLPTANEIIDSIEADEFIDGNLTNSRIFLGLNMDRPYRVSPAENGLKISFPKTLPESVNSESVIESAKTKAAGTDAHNFRSASLLKTVTATPLENNAIVNVHADGTIMNYKSFAIDNPARIVFDIYDIKSSHKGGRIIAVDSKWVQRIRYTPYPDKIRLVLDTDKQFLTKYFSFPTGSGLLIYVGRMPEPLSKKG